MYSILIFSPSFFPTVSSRELALAMHDEEARLYHDAQSQRPKNNEQSMASKKPKQKVKRETPDDRSSSCCLS
jgi:hypothetical protein